jgi:hypothetical protein
MNTYYCTALLLEKSFYHVDYNLLGYNTMSANLPQERTALIFRVEE